MMIGLVLLVIGAFYLFNSSNSKASCCMNHQSHTNAAQDILAERYARGEIDRVKYLERKQELTNI